VTRRYHAVLGITAVLILAVGMMIRPEEPAEMVAPSADESPLRQLSKDAALRDQAELIEDRVDHIARELILLPDGRKAVRWRPGSVVTTGDSAVLEVVAIGDTLLPADSVVAHRRVRWVVAAARDRQDSVVSVAGLTGGTVEATCGGFPLREVLLNQSIPPALAGAGVFTMGGERFGIVAKCDGRLVILPGSEVDRYLRAAAVPAVPVDTAGTAADTTSTAR
jgi:hypothetical protein